MPQLENLYRANWQNFIANTAVKQYLGISDNTTADYISKSIGDSTFATEDMKDNIKNSGRALMTPDEIRVASDKNIILQVDRRFTVRVAKQSYRATPSLANRWDKNTYHKERETTMAAGA